MAVESASDGVSGVDADPEGILLLEPQGEGAEESTSDSLPTALFVVSDPLEFGVAVVAAGQMTGDESYQLFFVFLVDCDEGCAGCESVLGRVFST